MTTKSILMATAVGFAFTGAAHATTFSDSATFLAANDIDFTETFSELTDETLEFDGPIAFASGITVSSESNSLFTVGTGQSTNTSVAIGSNSPGSDTLTIALGGMFSALGLDIFQNNGGGAQLAGLADFTITALSGGSIVATFDTTVAPNGGSYFGFTTDSLFDTVNIASNGGLFEVVDNVSAGAAGVSAVPLPASLPLLLAGFGALGIARRRKVKS